MSVNRNFCIHAWAVVNTMNRSWSVKQLNYPYFERDIHPLMVPGPLFWASFNVSSFFMNILVKYFVCLFKSCENMDEHPCQHVLRPQCVTLTGCKLWWCCICSQMPREAESLVVEREEQGVWPQWCLVELLSLQPQLLQSIPLGLHSQTYCLHLNPVLGLFVAGPLLQQ